MRRHIGLILSLLVLAVLAGLGAWAVSAAEGLSGGWASLLPILPYVVAGAFFVGLLTGGLMWLAFYSARHGYDDRVDNREDATPPRSGSRASPSRTGGRPRR